MKTTIYLTAALSVSIFFCSIVCAKENINKDTVTNHQNTKKIKALCATASSKATLDINNVRAGLLNGGDMWWDSNQAIYEVPKGSGKHAIFAGAIWFGGLDQGGQLMVAAQRYRQTNQQSYWPGPLTNSATISDTACLLWDDHYKVNRVTICDFTTKYQQGQITTPADVDSTILYWPAKGNPHINDGRNMNQNLAPFVDVTIDGVYDPMTGDYPNVKGDQSVWWVINDAGGQKVGMEPENAAIGLEIQNEAYALTTGDVLNNTTFYHYKLINKSNNILDSAYLAQWIDVDLGYFEDDYVGCDTSRNMGIVYNGDDFDEDTLGGYGADPPLLGVSFLEGIKDTNGIDIGMSNFIYYNNNANIVNGNPDKGIHYYNYMRNIWKNGADVTNDGMDGTNQSFPHTDYMYWGNPTDTSAWSECTAANTPGDTRFVMSSGPFIFAPGAVKDVTVAVVWIRPANIYPCPDFSLLGDAMDSVKAFFDTTTVFSCPITGINDDIIQKYNIRIYPNPTKSSVTINYSLNDNSKVIELSLYNIFGQKVKAIRLPSVHTGTYTLNLKDLSEGTYFCNIFIGGKLLSVKKLILIN
ncbi:MAG: T9SS type A sorting domain-containing protein [Cytophagales bacterium]|nr:T9SS type A sorting domain-containing protein [Cytophagales bacterium]